MKISLLSPNLSSNGLGRAYLLAKILQRHYEVEIIGPVYGQGIWKPVANDGNVKYKAINIISGKLKAYRQLWREVKLIDGDVIYASKPLFSSYDVGLMKKWLYGRPLVLDIDDWELGFLLNGVKKSVSGKGLGRVQFYLQTIERAIRSPIYSYLWVALNEKLVKFSDEITVSNNFLQARFGGTIIWHARDLNDFDPSKFDKVSSRTKYRIAQAEKTVIFCGTPNPHKGIEDLITAMRYIPEVVLIIVGIDGRDYCQKLTVRAERELGSKRVKVFGVQPFSEIMQFLAMSDIVVIPQRKSFETVGQVPAKLFDAMAMQKPTITTKVSDLPEILGDCGWLVEPGQPYELANAISYVLNHPEEANEKAQKARERCKAMYSYDAMEERLCELFKKYE
jgi:glycosyltransferase involved in cell wall biosynthesis